MQDDRTPEAQIREAFEQLRGPLAALGERWRRRVEGVRLREHVAAIEAGMATIAASAQNPGYVAVLELIRFFEEVRRRWVSGPVLPALRAARALLRAWTEWISREYPELEITRLEEGQLEELLAAAAIEEARARRGEPAPDHCAICAILEKQRARRN